MIRSFRRLFETKMISFKLNVVALLIVVFTLGGTEGSIFWPEGGIYWPEGFGLHCFKPCFMEYSPVCGTNGTTVRTFSSSCELLGYNCWQKKAFQEVKVGECDGTEDFEIQNDSRFCSDNFDPVCGSKGNEKKTFSNVCLLHAFNRKHLRDQFSMMHAVECQEAIHQKQINKNCSPCTKIYSPVCGKDANELITFPSECVMKNYNCFESRSFRVINEGVCPDKYLSVAERKY